MRKLLFKSPRYWPAVSSRWRSRVTPGVGDLIDLSAVAAPVPAIEVICVMAAALAAWLAPLFVLDRGGPQGEILAKPGTAVLRRLRLPLARDQAEVE